MILDTDISFASEHIGDRRECKVGVVVEKLYTAINAKRRDTCDDRRALPCRDMYARDIRAKINVEHVYKICFAYRTRIVDWERTECTRYLARKERFDRSGSFARRRLVDRYLDSGAPYYANPRFKPFAPRQPRPLSSFVRRRADGKKKEKQKEVKRKRRRKKEEKRPLLVGGLRVRAVDIISFLHGRLREKHFVSPPRRNASARDPWDAASAASQRGEELLTSDETPDVTEKTRASGEINSFAIAHE